jgi:hypothetical protein
MSLIWPNAEADVVANQPRLHALVVGVADYPHLNGGGGPPALDPLGLSQVTCPAVTAKEIARWLLSDYSNHPSALGSVELLLSPHQVIERPDHQMIPAENATFDAIESAFNRWVKRCSSDPGNTAFFYFCGHGLNKVTQFLLPQDFGDPKWADPWRNCVDFDGLRVGMRSCKARTQLFFVDACRETPFGMLDQIAVTGQSLIKAKFSDSVDSSAAYYATTEGKRAFGPENDVTYFGRAVTSCLSGAGTVNTNGRWVVNTYSIGSALGLMMAHLGRRHALALSCNPNVSGMGSIHDPASPKVIASIRCTSRAADAAAEIVLQRGGDIRTSPVGDQRPLIAEILPGEWTIDVKFPGGQFQNGSKLDTLIPPVYEGVPLP